MSIVSVIVAGTDTVSWTHPVQSAGGAMSGGSIIVVPPVPALPADPADPAAPPPPALPPAPALPTGVLVSSPQPKSAAVLEQVIAARKK
jgi:hypothetical protein